MVIAQMLSANQCRWTGNNLIRFLLLLLFGAGACSGPSVVEKNIRCSVVDSQVWNDSMPGSKPKCHAIMMIRMENIGVEDITFYPVEGVLRDTETGEALRRFALIMEYEDVRSEEARIASGKVIELRLRTPIGVPPIDQKKHPSVQFVASMRSSFDIPLTIESRHVSIFVTQ